ncbi:protein kinase domain-containing protein [Planctomycetaceae bacterium SH139]
MTNSNRQREAAFDRVIHQYYQAIDRGELVEPESFIARHPHFADELKSFFTDLQIIDDAPDIGTPSQTTGPNGPSSLHPILHLAKPGDSLTYIGEYRILEEIARGGMGVVYLARHEQLGRDVALKMILTGRLASQSEIDRFRREAKSAATLRHPNLVTVYEIGDHQGSHYFTMDYIESVSLADRLREGSLPPIDAAKLLETIAQATHYAHKQGILHRDLKPANVLIDNLGQPHVTDFGLAKPIVTTDAVSQTEITLTGQIIGTPSYMAPEQAAAKHQLVSVASDVYSLGAILYACLSGRAPFVAESTLETLRQVIHEEPLPARILNPRVPKDLETICLKCLSKEPHHRYHTADALAADLRRYLEGRPVVARPVNVLVKTWRAAKRNPWPALALSLVVLIAFISPLITIQQVRQSRLLSVNSTRIEQQNDEITDLLSSKQKSLQLAITAEKQATASSAAARAQALSNRRLLYIADMQRMAGLYEDANIRAMRNALERHVPAPGEPDFRDFEWYYWRGKQNGGAIPWQQDTTVEKLELSKNGQWIASYWIEGKNTRIQIRNANTGKLKRTFTLPGLQVTNFQFRCDHELVVAALGEYQTIHTIDWPAGKIITKVLSFPKLAQMPASRFVFSESGKLVAHAFLGNVRCYSTITGQAIKVRLPENADISQIRNQGVVYKDKDGHYQHFMTQVAGAVQTHMGASVLQSDPLNGVAQHWEAGNRFAPDSNQEGGPVMALSFSASEDLLAAGTREGHLKIWDLSSGHVLLDIESHQGIIWDLDFSPDDQQLASAGADGSVKIWDLSSGALEANLAGHNGGVKSICFSTDRQLASGGADRLIQIWRLPDTRPHNTLRGHEDSLSRVRISPANRSVWSVSHDGSVCKWSIADESSPIVIADPTPFYDAHLSADRSLVAASGLQKGITLWDTISGKPSFFMDPSNGYGYPTYHTRVSKKNLLGLRWDGALLHWDLTTGQRELRRKFPVQLIDQMPHADISEDGLWIAAQHKDGRVRIDSTMDDNIPSLLLDLQASQPLAVKFSPDGKHVLTNLLAAANQAGRDTSTLQLWDARSGKLIADIAGGHNLHGVISGNGRVAYVARAGTHAKTTGQTETLVIWDQVQGIPLGQYSMVGIQQLAISPDGTKLAIALKQEGAMSNSEPLVSLRLVSDGSEIARFSGNTTHIAFTTDSHQLIIAGEQGKLDLVDAESGQLSRQLVNSAGRVTSVSYSPDATNIAATFTNRHSSGHSVISLSNPTLQDTSLAPANIRNSTTTPIGYLPDGRLNYRGLAWRHCELQPAQRATHQLTEQYDSLPEALGQAANTCFFLAPDRTLFRFELAHPEKFIRSQKSLPGSMTPQAVAASRDGSRVALALADSVHIYDGESLESLHVLREMTSNIRILAFSDDGSMLATGDQAGQVKIWQTNNWGLRAVFVSHTKPITDLCFSRWGQTLVSSSEDGEIVLSDVVTGAPKTSFSDHRGPVHGLAFSPQGDELASAGDDGTIRRFRAAE